MNAKIEHKSTQTWKPPVQRRSIKRVESIVEAARHLILESGSVDIKITEVARRADIPIGSIYQFFPNQSALISRLFEIEMSHVDDLLIKGMNEAKDLNQAVDQVEKLMRVTLEAVREKPLLFLIWSSASATPALRQADLRNTKENALRLTGGLIKLKGDADLESRYYPTALLICHLWGAVVQLCISLEDPREQSNTMNRYIEIVRSHLMSLLS